MAALRLLTGSLMQTGVCENRNAAACSEVKEKPDFFILFEVCTLPPFSITRRSTSDEQKTTGHPVVVPNGFIRKKILHFSNTRKEQPIFVDCSL